MIHKFLKIFFVFCISSLILGCGYQPLLSGKYQKFSIDNFDITGDKKLGRTLANKFNQIKSTENALTLKINSTKKRDISSKSATGSTTEYNLKIIFDIQAISNSNNKEIFSKTFSESTTFKASTLHVDTLNREKKIVEDIVSTIEEDLMRQLNLIYN